MTAVGSVMVSSRLSVSVFVSVHVVMVDES